MIYYEKYKQQFSTHETKFSPDSMDSQIGYIPTCSAVKNNDHRSCQGYFLLGYDNKSKFFVDSEGYSGTE
jgi:hypothetical protein